MAEYRNSLRSKRMIREAFAELIKERQDISKITVTEIVDRADISKSTFYCHYKDIYAVADEFGDEIIDLMNKTLDAYIKHNNPDDIQTYANQIIKALLLNESLYRKLLSSDMTYSFIEKLKAIFIQKVSKGVKLKTLSLNPTVKRVEINIIANSIIYTFVDYFKSDDRLGLGSLDDLSKVVDELLTSFKKLEA
ncbi:MAG: TetR/AcrR family transcriptional regulator [Acholeplasmatales bacterium]|nr:TetR/AcrR family transcriptional regulator [Acholeplasmatales bacterium]